MLRMFSKSPTTILVTGVTIGAIAGACAVMAAQPHMQSALGSLQAARAELVRAEANKGGQAGASRLQRAQRFLHVGLGCHGDAGTGDRADGDAGDQDCGRRLGKRAKHGMVLSTVGQLPA